MHDTSPPIIDAIMTRIRSGWYTLFVFMIQMATLALEAGVTRLLSPEDFGIFAVSTAILGLASAFTLSSVLLPRTHTTLSQMEVQYQSHLGALFWGNIILQAGIGWLIYHNAIRIAAFFHIPNLAYVLHWQVWMLAFTPFAAFSTSILIRESEWTKVAVLDVVQGLVTASVALGLARYTPDITSLAYGAVAGVCARMLLGWVYAIPLMPASIMLFRFRTFSGRTREFIYALLQEGMSALAQSVDLLLLGRFALDRLTGFYFRIISLFRLLSPVHPYNPALAFEPGVMIATDLTGVRRFFLQRSQAVAMIWAPLFLIGVLYAPSLLFLMFGPAWVAVTPLVKWLLVVLLFRMMIRLICDVLVSQRISYGDMVINFMSVLMLMVGAWWAFAFAGIEGVACVTLAVSVIHYGLLLMIVLPVLNISFFRYIGLFWPLFIVGALVWGVNSGIHLLWPYRPFNAGDVGLYSFAVFSFYFIAILVFKRFTLINAHINSFLRHITPWRG